MSQRGTDSAYVRDETRTLRLRENKRRNRQQQKDYTASLESRLRHLESEGIKATQEVQSSARKVVEDNLRLKALLRYKGVDEHTINTWTPESDTRKGEKQEKFARESNQPLSTLKSSSSPCDQNQLLSLTPSQTPPSTEANLPTPCPSSGEGIQSNDSFPKLAPCKLMSHLASNPSTDLTQIEISDQQVETNDGEGIECSQAYKMLIRFATTEEKLDTISQALESGCVKGSKGGCKVRNETIWRTIDDIS